MEHIKESRNIIICEICNGTGNNGEKECKYCNGSGRKVVVSFSIEVDFKLDDPLRSDIGIYHKQKNKPTLDTCYYCDYKIKPTSNGVIFCSHCGKIYNA